MTDLENQGYELGWDAEIENEGQPFLVAEAGDYDFQVVGFERGRFEGSAKMSPCNMAKLTLRLAVPVETGICNVKHNLFLHSKTEWKLCEFFISIGQKKQGQKVAMNWSKVLGAQGRCKVSKRSFISQTTGKEMWTNDIDKFYPPAESPATSGELPFYMSQPTQSAAPAPAAYTPGKF